jgi:hypothetical protein
MNECKAARWQMCPVLTIATCGHSWLLRNSLMNEGRPHTVHVGVSAVLKPDVPYRVVLSWAVGSNDKAEYGYSAYSHTNLVSDR